MILMGVSSLALATLKAPPDFTVRSPASSPVQRSDAGESTLG